jgi:isopropylmalate/homocitrate/citramalate synthase
LVAVANGLGTTSTKLEVAELLDDMSVDVIEASVPSMAPDVALAMPFIPARLRADLERSPLEPPG